MSTKALERLQDHPTPWWSEYALRHPTVVLRTLRAHAANNDHLQRTLTACGLAAMGFLAVMALMWFVALNPRTRAEMPHFWIEALGITLVVMTPAFGILVQQLRAAYKSVMLTVQNRHPGAFLQIAEAWEREHERVVLKRTAEAVAPKASLPAPVRKRL